MAATSTPAAPPPPLEHAHHRPPPHIRSFHKALQRADIDSPPADIAILDFSGYDAASDAPLSAIAEYHRSRLRLSGTISHVRANEIFARFEGVEAREKSGSLQHDIPIYTHSSVPGLQLIPSLLPLPTQAALLTTLLTTSLSATETHKTNLHAHYTLPVPCPFFTLPPSTLLAPLTPVHKPLALSQALTKKLRWLTLGGQYDWTAKRYPPATPPPSFPASVAALVSGLIPATTPQAAIVNLYSPGDTLAPHRDISEASGAGLVSVSVGCAGVFVIGCEVGEVGEVLAVRLNSGDAVVMAGESRWAWHSVPKVLAGTCPPQLEAWDGGSELWRGWCARKRVNLNVRQMWD